MSLEEEIAGLDLCLVTPRHGYSEHAARAAGWRNRLARLGLRLPLFLVRDLGLLWALPHALLELEALAEAGQSSNLGELGGLRGRYGSLLATIAHCEPVAEAATLRLGDDVIAVLLYRLCKDLPAARAGTGVASEPPFELPLVASAYQKSAVLDLQGRVSLARHQAFLQELLGGDTAQFLTLRCELVDTATLKLLGAQKDGDAGYLDGSGDLLELLSALSAAQARDVARFALELLPSLFESHRTAGVQHYPSGGYAALERRGALDGLPPGELLADSELLLSRLLEGELPTYGRERQAEDEPPQHLVLVDASPGMFGLRQVFARGLALAMLKDLQQRGARTTLRFFDARLHEAVSGASRRVLPLLIGWGWNLQSGRSYATVLRELLSELRQSAPARSGGALTIHLITHAEFHVPVELVRALAERARLHCVYVLPAHGLALGYLNLLSRYDIIEESALARTEVRRARALAIATSASAI